MQGEITPGEPWKVQTCVWDKGQGHQTKLYLNSLINVSLTIKLHIFIFKYLGNLYNCEEEWTLSLACDPVTKVKGHRT